MDQGAKTNSLGPDPPVVMADPGGTARRVPVWVYFAGMVGVLFAVLILYWFPPEQYGFYPRCGLYVWTGLHCPACGSLRAVHQLSHGHVLQAMSSNALLVLSLGGGVIWAGIRLLGFGPFAMRSAWSGWLIPVFLALVVLFGLLRNLPWPPFSLLAP